MYSCLLNSWTKNLHSKKTKELQKYLILRDTLNSGIADHMWNVKNIPTPLRKQKTIVDIEQHWKNQIFRRIDTPVMFKISNE